MKKKIDLIMRNKIAKQYTIIISLVLISSFSVGFLSKEGFSTNVDDSSFSVSNLSTQDTFWPGNSSQWTEVAPETQGLDSDKIADMFEFIEEGSHDIHSVIVVKNGYILTQEYLYNSTLLHTDSYYGGETLHMQQSTTKSLTSILIGIALKEGFINNLNQTLYEFFADRWRPEPFMRDSEMKKNITIKQLLMMNAGLSGDAYPPKNTTNFDCIKFALQAVPLSYTPGQEGEFEYSNEGVNLLSGIIANVTGNSTAEFAQEYLFTPLEISEDEYYWWHDDYGNDYGAYGFDCTPKVQAKLGMLCLNNGTWNGTQIVEPNYMADALSYLTTFESKSGGDEVGYGYLFYVTDTPYDMFYTYGAGGQCIYVVPEYNITVGFTGETGANYESFLEKYIVQFAEENAPDWDEIPEDQLRRKGESFYYDVNATDTSGVEYSINDRVNFNITPEGIITNTSSLPVGVYPLEIKANNTFNNNITAAINIRYAEDIAPEWDEIPENQTILEGEFLFYDVNASCVSGVEYSINNTVNFNITPEGIITNTSSLSVGVYTLEIRAYNPFNNSTMVTINIRVQSIIDDIPSDDIPSNEILLITSTTIITILGAIAVLIIWRKRYSRN